MGLWRNREQKGADKAQWIWDHLRVGSFLIRPSGPVPRSAGQSPGSFGLTPEASGGMRNTGSSTVFIKWEE